MRPVIIGVVGQSGDRNSDTINLAKALGGAIIRRRWILLTGGRPLEKQASSVKEAAMQGALAEAKSRKVSARVIGILPKLGKYKEWTFEKVKSNGISEGYLYTDLHDCRNVLTGLVPDALLALKGGGGTISEIAFASSRGRPVVFVDSLNWLNNPNNEPEKLNRIVDDVLKNGALISTLTNLGITKETVKSKLSRVFQTSPLIVNASDSTEDTAEQACDTIFKALSADFRDFPELQGHEHICRQVSDWLSEKL